MRTRRIDARAAEVVSRLTITGQDLCLLRPDGTGLNSGSAYVFKRSGGQIRKYVARDGAQNHRFGTSVSYRGVAYGSLNIDDGGNYQSILMAGAPGAPPVGSAYYMDDPPRPVNSGYLDYLGYSDDTEINCCIVDP